MKQLAGVGQAALVAPGGRPGVAEIDVQALDLLLGRKELSQPLNIISAQGHVVRLLFPVGLGNVPPAHAQNVVADVDSQEIHIPVGVGGFGQKDALAAAQVQVERALFPKHRLPAAPLLLGLCHK